MTKGQKGKKERKKEKLLQIKEKKSKKQKEKQKGKSKKIITTSKSALTTIQRLSDFLPTLRNFAMTTKTKAANRNSWKVRKRGESE